MAAKKAIQGKAVIGKKNKDGTEEQVEETVGKPKLMPEEQICQIGHKLGYTKNLGNYESLRVDVMITMPGFPHEVEEISAFEVEWADGRMSEIMDEIEKDMSE